MHGRSLRFIGALLVIACAGCTEDTPGDPPVTRAYEAGSRFDPAKTGTIEGRVVWSGSLPEVPAFMVFADPDNPPPDRKMRFNVANPYRPEIDPASNGLQDVVVFLRAVDPQLACPWPHGTVRIEQRDRRLRVLQNGVPGRVGFVRCGDAMEAVNYDAEYHALRVRGAAFFTLPFVDAATVTRRRLDRPGLVELMSGASYFWMNAKLLVVEHPYYARTAADGSFRLEQVPAGRHELVCWMPSWVVTRRERDPESCLISRLVFAPAVEQVEPVEVRERGVSSVRFEWNEGRVVGP
jgi:hypothetical protein